MYVKFQIIKITIYIKIYNNVPDESMNYLL
jgi:hypothetical protein